MSFSRPFFITLVVRARERLGILKSALGTKPNKYRLEKKIIEGAESCLSLISSGKFEGESLKPLEDLLASSIINASRIQNNTKALAALNKLIELTQLIKDVIPELRAQTALEKQAEEKNQALNSHEISIVPTPNFIQAGAQNNSPENTISPLFSSDAENADDAESKADYRQMQSFEETDDNLTKISKVIDALSSAKEFSVKLQDKFSGPTPWVVVGVSAGLAGVGGLLSGLYNLIPTAAITLGNYVLSGTDVGVGLITLGGVVAISCGVKAYQNHNTQKLIHTVLDHTQAAINVSFEIEAGNASNSVNSAPRARNYSSIIFDLTPNKAAATQALINRNQSPESSLQEKLLNETNPFNSDIEMGAIGIKISATNDVSSNRLSATNK